LSYCFIFQSDCRLRFSVSNSTIDISFNYRPYLRCVCTLRENGKNTRLYFLRDRTVRLGENARALQISKKKKCLKNNIRISRYTCFLCQRSSENILRISFDAENEQLDNRVLHLRGETNNEIYMYYVFFSFSINFTRDARFIIKRKRT